MASQYAVNLENISKSYGELKVLKDASGSIQAGSFTSLIGPNGCGKSTLLKILSGIEQASSGSFEVPEKLAYVPQKNSLMPWLSVQQNLEFADKITKTLTPNLDKKIDQLLAQFELASFRDYYPTQLSGGMQQKLSIISAMLRDPQLLLLDEPFSSLDSITRRSLQSWLLDVWQERKITVICVTHDIREAINLSDTILVMSSRPGSISQRFKIQSGEDKIKLAKNQSIERKLEWILLT